MTGSPRPYAVVVTSAVCAVCGARDERVAYRGRQFLPGGWASVQIAGDGRDPLIRPVCPPHAVELRAVLSEHPS